MVMVASPQRYETFTANNFKAIYRAFKKKVEASNGEHAKYKVKKETRLERTALKYPN